MEDKREQSYISTHPDYSAKIVREYREHRKQRALELDKRGFLEKLLDFRNRSEICILFIRVRDKIRDRIRDYRGK